MKREGGAIHERLVSFFLLCVCFPRMTGCVHACRIILCACVRACVYQKVYGLYMHFSSHLLTYSRGRERNAFFLSLSLSPLELERTEDTHVSMA